MIIGQIEYGEDEKLIFSICKDREQKTVSPDYFKSQFFDLIWFLIPAVNTMIYDIHLPAVIPARNLSSVLTRELSYRLPVDPASVVWCYKKLTPQDFRILVMPGHRMEHYIALLRQHALTLDRFVPAQLLEPDGRFDTIYPELLHVPKDLRVVRHRNWKRLYWLLLFLCATVLAGIGHEKYRIYRQESDRLQAIKTELAAELRQLQGQFGALAAEQELQNTLRSLSFDLEPLLPRLEELNRKLPAHMWITNYLQNGSSMDIAIESREDEPNFYRQLEGTYYRLINLRKSQGSNGATVFYVKLKGAGHE